MDHFRERARRPGSLSDVGPVPGFSPEPCAGFILVDDLEMAAPRRKKGRASRREETTIATAVVPFQSDNLWRLACGQRNCPPGQRRHLHRTAAPLRSRRATHLRSHIAAKRQPGSRLDRQHAALRSVRLDRDCCRPSPRLRHLAGAAALTQRQDESGLLGPMGQGPELCRRHRPDRGPSLRSVQIGARKCLRSSSARKAHQGENELVQRAAAPGAGRASLQPQRG